MAENETTEAARRQLAQDKEARDKSAHEYSERMKGKPTPTQEENDLAALGANVTEHEEDGAPPDPNVRHVEAGKGGAYQTRHVGAAPQHRPATPTRSPSRE